VTPARPVETHDPAAATVAIGTGPVNHNAGPMLLRCSCGRGLQPGERRCAKCTETERRFQEARVSGLV